MTDALRIGYFLPRFPGQTHAVFWREVLALEKMGHKVCLLSIRKPLVNGTVHNWADAAMARCTYLGQFNPLPAAQTLAKLVRRGFKFWMLLDAIRHPRDVFHVLTATHGLLRYAERNQLDHVHVHSTGMSALIAALSRYLGGPRFSMTVHGPLPNFGKAQRFKWSTVSFATTLNHALYADIQSGLAGVLPEQVEIQPLGVDVNALERNQPYEPPEKGRPVQIFSCGRLHETKGHQDLISAMRQLLDQGVDVRLEIAGEEDTRSKGFRMVLEDQVKRLRLQDHVKLPGALDSDAVKDRLERAHLFVLASLDDPSGLSCIEAMACGVPVIATRAGGLTEVIMDGQTGELVPPGTPSALARAIRELSGNPQALQRLSAAGRAHVERHFNIAQTAETLDRLIRLTRAQNSDD